MVKRYHILSILIFALFVRFSTLYAETRSQIFHPDIRTVQVYSTAAGELSDPVIVLGDADTSLTVEFDEIGSERRYMRYSLTHCDARWQPSKIADSEYIEGFNEGTIDGYEFSRATTVQYVHYMIQLPNDQIRFTLSGNYLLKVYDENDPDKVMFQVRFKVVEPIVTMTRGDVTSHTDVDYNDSHQQLSFILDVDNLTMRDAFNDLVVEIDCNNSESTRRYLEHPLSVRAGDLVYEHLPQLIFRGGNEYRRFETVSTRVPGMNVAAVEYHAPYYHAWIGPDTPRAGMPYLYDSTQHGRFVVREYDSDDSDVEADYIVTHFTLQTDPLPDGETIGIEGDLVNREVAGRAVMDYNSETGCYETALLLKQGAYNYRYVVLPGDGNNEKENRVDGDYYNTTNEYHISVYHTPLGRRYDRLVGYFIVNI